MTADTLQLPIAQNQLIEILRAHGVMKASVFGSFARGDFNDQSDLDLLIEYSVPTSLFDQIGLQQELELATHRLVDVATKIHPVFEPFIQDELIPLPL